MITNNKGKNDNEELDKAILMSKKFSDNEIRFIINDENFTQLEQNLIVGVTDANNNNNGITLKDIFVIRDVENQTLFDHDRTTNTEDENEELTEQLEFIYDQLIKLMLEGSTSEEIIDYYLAMRSESDLGVGKRRTKQRTKRSNNKRIKRRSNKRRSNKIRTNKRIKRRSNKRRSNKRIKKYKYNI